MSDPIVTKIATEIHDTVLRMVRVGKRDAPIRIVLWLRGLTHERLGLKNTKELMDSIIDKKPNAISDCEYLLDGATNGERVMIKKRLKLMNTELDKKVSLLIKPIAQDGNTFWFNLENRV